MKYLKKFENIEENFYWRVPTDKRMKLALKKINYPTHMMDRRLNRKYNTNYIYITKSIYGEFGWETNLEWLKSNNYIFMGNVDIEDYELDSEKYNL